MGDRCVPVEVDGVTMRVMMGAGQELTARDREALAELAAAVKRRYDREHPAE